jgi:hypothetical protein
MTGPTADYFMGALAITLGALALLASLLNWEAAFQLRKAQWLETRFGRPGARLSLAVLGAVLLALGVAIALGYAPNARPQSFLAPAVFRVLA